MHDTRPTLLVIEDAEDHATLVAHAAMRCHPGLRVRMARNGYEGTAYLAGVAPFDDRSENPLPDLIILDLFMPEVDGFAVLQWIGRRPRFSAIPVVVLTASGNPDDETRARGLGASLVYRKPDNLTDLGLSVREIVGTYISRGRMIEAHMSSGG